MGECVAGTSKGAQTGSRPLTLADGSRGTCTTKIGPKGILMAVVPAKSNPDESEIDLLPISWLVERGCSVLCDHTWVITTPKNQAATDSLYEEMLYLTAKQIQLILATCQKFQQIIGVANPRSMESWQRR